MFYCINLSTKIQNCTKKCKFTLYAGSTDKSGLRQQRTNTETREQLSTGK